MPFRINIFSIKQIKFILEPYCHCVYREKSVKVSVGGRFDSPGCNAKYCKYSVMNQLSLQIVHFDVISLSETGSSARVLWTDQDPRETRKVNFRS